jgi:hypothetical protein
MYTKDNAPWYEIKVAKISDIALLGLEFNPCGPRGERIGFFELLPRLA